jgi:hypothetical protein
MCDRPLLLCDDCRDLLVLGDATSLDYRYDRATADERYSDIVALADKYLRPGQWIGSSTNPLNFESADIRRACDICGFPAAHMGVVMEDL